MTPLTRHLPAWCALALRVLGVMVVLGVACALAIQPHGELAAIDAGTSVEVLEDLEPDGEAVVIASTSAPPCSHAIATRLLPAPHRSPAARPAVPPPRR